MASVAVQGSSVATGHLCDTTTTLDTPGQSTVKIGGILVARKTDSTVTHEFKSGDDCVDHTATISGGSAKVFVAGKAIARLGDGCDAGSITSGNGSNVYAN